MGTNEEGEPIRDYMSILNPVLLDTLAGVTEEEKLRIVILYILNQNGISEEKLNKLLQHGNIESTRSIIMNLEKLAINVVTNSVSHWYNTLHFAHSAFRFGIRCGDTFLYSFYFPYIAAQSGSSDSSPSDSQTG
jgi:hypothetical protein